MTSKGAFQPKTFYDSIIHVLEEELIGTEGHTDTVSKAHLPHQN